MAFAMEALGQLILQIGLFSTGMAFGILGLVLGISRSTTKNAKHWALIFSAFAWVIALTIPNVFFSSIIFVFGAFGLSIAFMPLIEKVGDKNIFMLAILAGLLNLLILTGTGAYGLSLGWQDNFDNTVSDVENLLYNHTGVFNSSIPKYEICTPNEVDEDGEPCKTDAVSGSFNENLFVPFASILTIGTYIGKTLAFIAMVATAPLILAITLVYSDYFGNTIITILMGIMVILWQMAIFYKLIAFILNKRGMK